MTVVLDRRGAVGVITLQREHKRNAMDRAMTADLDAALEAVEDDRALRVGVLTGGDRVFSAGTDLAEFDRDGIRTPQGGEYGIVRRRRTKPLIAAVEGPALGGGLEILLACDLIVASETATFGFPEVARGVVASCGGLFRLQQVLPPVVAREMLLLGEAMPASRAYAVGLVNRIVPAGTALSVSVQMATAIAEHAPLAVARTLDALWATLGETEEAGWRVSDAVVDVVSTSADAREGRRAFLERRDPVWRGD